MRLPRDGEGSTNPGVKRALFCVGLLKSDIPVSNSLFLHPQMACADIIRSCLLKTSKALRQPLGGSPEKESKVKEYEAQYSVSKLVSSDPRGMLFCHTEEFLRMIVEEFTCACFPTK